MSACVQCGKDPAMGSSMIRSKRDHRDYTFCPPRVTKAQREGMSCFEVLGFISVERHPRERRPPQPIDAPWAAAARRWLSQHA